MKSTGSWIHDLVEENQEVETPTSWIYWSLMSCISAAAVNNYSLKTLKGNLIYAPNIYVILLGESGLGKGYPCSLAKRMMQNADVTRVIAGRSSIQAIIKELSTTRSKQGKPLITDARGFIVNGELSTAIIADPDSLTVLTDLYDGKDNPEWTNLLKGDGAEKLKDPYVTCLFGTSPSHFFDSVPQANIEGGYIGRNLVVFEQTRARNLDLLESESEVKQDEDKFKDYIVPRYVPHLIEISKRKLRLQPNAKARAIYNPWRHKWRAEQHVYNDKTGFVVRVPDHVLKVAMCLCLARYDNNGTITESDIAESIESVTALIYDSKQAVGGTGAAPDSGATKRVVDSLIAAPKNELSRQELLVRGYGNYDPTVLDRIIDNLMEMGWVKRRKEGIGKNMDWIIMLAGEPLESFKKFRSAKEKQRGEVRQG